MKREKNCRICAYYVCARKECNINNTEGCNEFRSIIQEAISRGGINVLPKKEKNLILGNRK